jgi:hypothetical protein
VLVLRNFGRRRLLVDEERRAAASQQSIVALSVVEDRYYIDASHHSYIYIPVLQRPLNVAVSQMLGFYLRKERKVT